MSRPPSPPAGEHRSVLAQPAVDFLLTELDGIYVDATFGRGGHSQLILDRLQSSGRLIALDRDPQAVDAARSIADPRFHVEHTPFSRLRVTLDALSISQVHGVLFDLGVSSPQIDDPARGFSLRADGPLDMRMDPTRGETAADWLARASFEELLQVIRDMAKSGLLHRLQRRLLLAAQMRRQGVGARLQRPQTLRLWSRTPSAGAARMRLSTRQRGRFRLYGFTSIESLRNWR